MRQSFRLVLALLVVLQIAALAMAIERPAYAYADPGAGLLFMQIASSVFAGALFIVRSKLRKLFRFGKPEATETPEALNDSGKTIRQ